MKTGLRTNRKRSGADVLKSPMAIHFFAGAYGGEFVLKRSNDFLSLRERIKVRVMDHAVQQAKRLRGVATVPEKRLWSHLRNRKLAGLKFRRQEPLFGYVIDFFCPEARLAIELDGSGHSRHFTRSSDLDREIDLHEKGIRLIRFHNKAIFENLAGVLNAIILAADPERSLWQTPKAPAKPSSNRGLSP